MDSSSFITAVLNTGYRRRSKPQPDDDTVPANLSAEELRRYQLGRMLHQALNPAEAEPTWHVLFKRSTALTAEPRGTTDEQEPK